MKAALRLSKRDVDYINSLWKDFEGVKDEMHVAIEESEKDKEWKIVELQ